MENSFAIELIKTLGVVVTLIAVVFFILYVIGHHCDTNFGKDTDKDWKKK